MNTDKIFISNTDIWIRYYQKLVQGKNDPRLSQMKTSTNTSFMIPLQQQSSNSTNEKEEHIKLRLVSPSAQMVEMAKETMKEEGIDIKKVKRKSKPTHKQTNKGRSKLNSNKKRKIEKRQNKDVFCE